MNYKNLYYLLVVKARRLNRAKSVGLEQHHILPKCKNGKSNFKNLVYLSYKEHYVAHHLLAKIYPESSELAQAFVVMVNGASNKYARHNGKISAKEHSKLKTLARPVLINSGKKQFDLKAGIHALEPEEIIKNGFTGGLYSLENKIGIHEQTITDRIELGKKYGYLGGKTAGVICKEKNKGVCGFTSEQNSRFGKMGGNKTVEQKLGLHALTEKDLLVSRIKGGRTSGDKAKNNKTGIHALEEQDLKEIRKKAGQANKNKSWKEWYVTLAEKKLNVDFKPTREQAIVFGLKWYWNPDKLCYKHPKEEGRRRVNRGACCACGK